MHLKIQEPATIMCINMLLKQTQCVICLPSLALFITQCGSENDREHFKHALLVYSTVQPIHGRFIPAVQTRMCSVCLFNLSSGVNMKHFVGKPHHLALVHLTYIPSPLPSAWGEGWKGRDHHQAGSYKIHSLAAANIHSLRESPSYCSGSTELAAFVITKNTHGVIFVLKSTCHINTIDHHHHKLRLHRQL